MLTRKSPSKRLLLWTGGSLAVLVAALAIYLAVMAAGMKDVPADLDYATRRLSDKNLFSVTYKPSTDPIPINQIHTWTLHIATPDGRPVENATISVDGDMPQHGHGLPTQPRVTQNLGNGDYLVEGMKFQMGGWWLMDFNISANNQTDVVHFNMMLQ